MKIPNLLITEVYNVKFYFRLIREQSDFILLLHSFQSQSVSLSAVSDSLWPHGL